MLLDELCATGSRATQRRSEPVAASRGVSQAWREASLNRRVHLRQSGSGREGRVPSAGSPTMLMPKGRLAVAPISAATHPRAVVDFPTRPLHEFELR